MKLDRFVNQAVITTSCSPVWHIETFHIRVTTLGTFLLPTIFHFNLGVININQFHRGNTLSYPPRKVNSFFQAFISFHRITASALVNRETNRRQFLEEHSINLPLPFAFEPQIHLTGFTFLHIIFIVEIV